MRLKKVISKAMKHNAVWSNEPLFEMHTSSFLESVKLKSIICWGENGKSLFIGKRKDNEYLQFTLVEICA